MSLPCPYTFTPVRLNVRSYPIKYDAEISPSELENILWIPPSYGTPEIGKISDSSGYIGSLTGKSSSPSGIRFVE